MNVPKLRFKDDGDQDFPDWEKKKLEEIANVERGKFSVRPRNDPRYFGGNIPFVQTGDIVSSDLYLTKFTQTLNEDGLKVSRLFPKNTILLTIAANIGDTTITSFEVACTDSVVAIQTYQDRAVPVWLKYALDTKKEELDSKSTQNAQKNINLQILRPLIFQIPSFKEQTKIANFLMVIDEKIAQLTQKCELLARYKKGVMQQIFSQELRFKDDNGCNFPDWEEKTLKDIFTIKYGKDYKHLNSGNIPVIGTGGIMTYVDQFLYDKPSVLMGRKGTINKPQFIENPFWTVDTLFYTEINKGFVPFFIYLLVSQINWYRFNEATGVPSLNTTAINNVDVFVPSSFQEQIKIANFFVSIDEKITQTQTYLETVKQYRQGLLQQMFI